MTLQENIKALSDIKDLLVALIDKLSAESAPNPSPAPSPAPMPEEKDKKAQRVRFNIVHMKNMSADFKKLYLKALKIADVVANSVEFKEKVEAFSFEENNGYSSAEIYQRFMNGQMDADETVDHSIDVGADAYFDKQGAYGYTYLGDTDYNLNTALLFSEDDIVNNLFHEYQHLEGFTHEVAWDNSVPYGVGNIAGELAAEVMQGKQLTQIDAFAGQKKVSFSDSRFTEEEAAALA